MAEEVQRKMKAAVENQAVEDFKDVQIIETDETAWIRIDDTFVDVNRVQAAGLSPENRVQLLLIDGSMINASGKVTLEEVMSLIVEATTEEEDED